MTSPAPIPDSVPLTDPAPPILSTPIIQTPLSLTPAQMSLTRQQLFDLTLTPLTLSTSRFLSLWPWIDNVYVRKKTRAATGRKLGYELWECRNRRKHPITAPVTPTARRGRPGATCLVGLKLVWNRYVEGEERTVSIERCSEATHTHTLDDMDKQKRSSAIRRIAAREAARAQPYEVANAMKADMETLIAVGGKYITRADVKNASKSYELGGTRYGAAERQAREHGTGGTPSSGVEGAERWQEQLLPGSGPWMETSMPTPTPTNARTREVDRDASAPISALQTHASPPAQTSPLADDITSTQERESGTPPPPPLTATTFLLIDSQAAFTHPTHWGPARSNPSYETNVATLLSHFRALRLAHPGAGPEIIHVRHASQDPKSPLHPDAAGFAWMPYTAPIPGEHIVTKNVNSAFIGTDLENMLRDARTRRLYVAGLTTDHCVSTSVRMAGNLGVVDGEWGRGEVVLVGDATACWEKVRGGWKAEIVHAVHVESLREFARVGWTGEVVRECVG
ncbi:hypothetical protein VC83_02814 [Pseudogymnoascus destructans]|uniref:Isochorismatase-like domain-containing protein n=2 Tax=Pseudogymnoascus destructans TaxID=655981 RepID=L8FYY2_PSED2|nr:uncharacterized protein VC83_02814 [Pseudogymnoascus destructans]ELR04926.1 hypothetical protein GMDG_00184 [Pseudogymnoascus destructans 20631-21]OAF60080.1 hypothetical protein VC83_02814 [Pseudogymnoascus destructans]